MPLSNEQYDSIMRSYEDKRRNDRYLMKKHIEQIYSTIPEYKQIDDSVSSISVMQGMKLLNGDSTALADLKKQLATLASQKQQLLVSAGYSADYLEPIYTCSDCHDTGYIDGNKCHCFIKEETTLLYEQSNIQNMVDLENFSSLSYEYYEGEDLSHFESAVASCKTFIKNFKSDYQNLFFYGTVGTGKSFLSGCIAKELIEFGSSVIYFSAGQLFETLSKNSFDYKNKENLNQVHHDLYNCDLLIIDDLGTELTNAFVSSQLFSCLNERHMRKCSTIISTNLSLEELRDRYSDRIFSRITSNYAICKLTGPDIRMYRKRMLNRK